MDGDRMRHAHVQPPGNPGIRRIGPTFHFGGDPDFPLLRFLLTASRRLGLSGRPKATLKQFLPKQLVRFDQVATFHPQSFEITVLEQTLAFQQFLLFKALLCPWIRV